MIRLKEPPGVLGKIVARTLADLPDRERAGLPERKVEVRNFAMALAQPDDSGFKAAEMVLPDGRVCRSISRPRRRPRRSGPEPEPDAPPRATHTGPALIAEFKPRSPSRGDIRPGAQIEELATLYAPFASAMSVLTDAPFFGADGGLLLRARPSMPAPLLRKDFIVTRFQVEETFALGADALLLMASLLTPASLSELLVVAQDLGLQALVEVHDERELDEALEAGARVIGVNSRDLTTLEIDLPRAHGLLSTIPADRVVVAESGLTTREAVEALPDNVNAVLIGTAFMSAPDPVAAIQALGFARCR